MNRGILEWIGGILGVIFLGVLCNALWTLVLEQPTRKLGKRMGGILFKMVTLGLSSLRDKLYAEVAKPNRERAARFLLITAITALLGTATMALGVYVEILVVDATMRISGNVTSGQDSKTIEKATDEYPPKIREMRRVGMVAIFFGLLVFCTHSISLLWNSLKLDFVDKYRTHLNRACDICLPSFQPREHETIISDMAQVKNRTDYVVVEKRLREIALRSNLKLPDIKIY